jgi:hypothetical protein
MTPTPTSPTTAPAGCPPRALSAQEQAFLDLGLVLFLNEQGLPAQQQVAVFALMGLMQNPTNLMPLAQDDLSLITDRVVSDLRLGPALHISDADLNQQIASLECEIDDLVHGTTT